MPICLVDILVNGITKESINCNYRPRAVIVSDELAVVKCVEDIYKFYKHAKNGCRVKVLLKGISKFSLDCQCYLRNEVCRFDATMLLAGLRTFVKYALEPTSVHARK
ncbi:hypothetical protein ACH5RR_001197 [Cinchona calisaya]|uniref:SWIM-type domain-containing protein n=1 Tax=Cinchona calisaya TaxID=153742 RepID=A0ABD3B3B1_9GENT